MRAISKGRGPWWFSSSGGRFDLPEPYGTCYLADDAQTAVRERAGAALLNAGVLTSSFVDEMQLARVRLPVRSEVADLGDDTAVAFGCSRELSTVPDYQLSSAWASAFHTARLDGIRYGSRFTSGSQAKALALFGDHGDAALPVEEVVSGRDAVIEAGLGDLLDVRPSSRRVSIISPPGVAISGG